MNLGIVAVAYNGYGKFVPQLCESIASMTKKPSQVTIVVYGKNHGLNEKKCAGILGDIPLKVIREQTFVNMGRARNLAIEHTPTEWIMYISADDVILPGAIEEFEKHTDADVISIAFVFDEEGKKPYVYDPVLPTKKEIFSKNFYSRNAMNFFVAFSPFRRSVWERVKYADVEYPNAPFWIDLALADARFTKTSVPCAVYRKRKDGVSGHNNEERRMEIAKEIASYKLKQRTRTVPYIAKRGPFAVRFNQTSNKSIYR